MSELPSTFKVVTVWLLIGVGGMLGVTAWQAQRARPQLQMANGAVELQRGPDGHYHWPGSINGRSVEFLVDTGATRSALPMALAHELQLEVLDTFNSQTANGPTQGELVRADLSLQGSVRLDHARIAALPALDAPLLGMDVLGKLNLVQRGQVLRVEPSPSADHAGGKP